MHNKAKILANLKPHGCKWVNYFIVVSGLEQEDNAGNELKELIHDNKVEKQMISLGYDKFDRPISAPLYRIMPNYSTLETDNGLHLVAVK